MKTYEVTGIVLLLLVGVSQAVNTVSMLTDKEVAESQEGLVHPLESRDVSRAVAPEEALRTLDQLDETLVRSAPDFGPDMWVAGVGEATPSGSRAVEEAPATRVADLIGRPDPNASWRCDRCWRVDPAKSSGPGLAGVGRGVQPVSLDELDRVPGSSPTTRAAFVMEIIVFPALAAVVLVLACRLLVLRIHDRRSIRRFERLLHA
ncbi:MAG TPA: hypothetical protein PKH24_16275 [Sedimentisphaerales bacterium]|jgi:hypothetical protein|nr:hypothetical protein [Sedimentisphaerales bacterium]HNU30671.1 hypothetical protein [Sedimentisphaerales bacterium]